MYLKNRERQIINMMLKNQSVPLRIYDIAQQLGVSSRTVHRELKSIEKSLSTLNISLIRQKNKGISIQGPSSSISHLQQSIHSNGPIDLSIEEQKVILLYALIQSSEPLKQLGLASEIGTSLQQLSKILDELEKDLEQFRIQLVRKRGSGVSIQGSEMKKRELLSQLMMERLNSLSVYSVIENHFVFQSLTHERLPMMDVKEIFQIERLLMDDLDSLPYLLTESSYLNLIIHIALSVDRMKKKQYVSIDLNIVENMKTTLEFQVATSIATQLSKMYHIEFNTAEITFIAIHLQSSKRKHEKSGDLSIDIHQSIQKLVHLVESSLNMTFKNRRELIEGLQLHITPALNRIQFNIETYNPMTQRIQASYPKLFIAIEKSVHVIWPTLSFSKHEIAFLVLHFGGVMKANSTHRRVLVVCSSGVGTSRILTNRLYEAFSNIDSIQQVSVGELKSLSLDNYDAIISTVDLDIQHPYLTVNPLLPNYEVERTSRFLQQQFSKHQSDTFQSYKPNKLSTDANHTINKMRESLKLLDDFQIYDLNFKNNWARELAYLLRNDGVIKESDISLFEDQLRTKHDTQSFALSPYPIAIPHFVSDIIQKPYIIVIHLDSPIDMKSDNDISTLICAFLPSNSLLSNLISNIYSELALKIEDLSFIHDEHQLYQFIQLQIIYFNQ
ncbi:PTS lactose transporter subunit IIB [Staphylococcus felis]|uniref:BglG family transcription antiterminator n=1 Tax=Staphylococcus felis TaxID=46127 RepID=UPI000E239B45|nr:BglG family transcription antiterminator [Staphylococcus felis]REI11244.1 PTS lactose transporter subunit IIB [Staphylococcus felis]